MQSINVIYYFEILILLIILELDVNVSSYSETHNRLLKSINRASYIVFLDEIISMVFIVFKI